VGVLNEELARDGAITLTFRTGVMTGEVVAGDHVLGDTLVTGDAVNTAARLEQHAPPGEILLGMPTWRLVRDIVEAEPVAPIAAKGKALPVPAFRLVAVGPDRARVGRAEWPLVGRRAELDRLGQAWERVVTERSPHRTTVVGVAGVGKSRLVHEFLANVRESGGRVLGGRCLPYGEGITYWPLREIVHQAAGIGDGDGREMILARLASLVEGDTDARLIAAVLASAVGSTSDPVRKEEIFWATGRVLQQLAMERPLTVLIEDIHWADGELLDLLEHLADLPSDAPLLLLCPARPELGERRPDWLLPRASASSILLDGLPSDGTAALIAAFPGSDALPAVLRERIAARAEGNPLFLVEMYAMLVDEGLLRVDGDGSWRATDGLADVAVPPSIGMLLAARIDALPPEERTVAQRAAVIGRVFDLAAVRDLGGAEGPAGLDGALRGLVEKGLVKADGAERADTFRFRHVLLRDAAYEALPKSERAALHARYADWLETSAGERVMEYEEILGHHLEAAHRYRGELGERGELVEHLAGRGGEWLGRAASRARRRGAMAAAAPLLRRSLALLPEADARRGDLLVTAVEVHTALGDGPAATAAHEAAHAYLARHPDPHLERLLRLLALRGQRELDVRAQAEIAHKIYEAARSEGHEGDMARAATKLALLAGDQGDSRRSVAELEDALAHARRAEDDHIARGVRMTLVNWVAFSLIPVPDGRRMAEDVLADDDARQDERAYALLAIGALDAMAGDVGHARGRLQAARAIADQLGLVVPLAAADWAFTLGWVELLFGDADRAEPQLRWACEVLRRGDDLGHLASVAPLWGRALLALGRPQDAERVVMETRPIVSDHDVDGQMRWRLLLAEIRSQQGRHDEVLALADEAASLLAGSDMLPLVAELSIIMARVRRRAGDEAGSAASIARAVDASERKVAPALTRLARMVMVER